MPATKYITDSDTLEVKEKKKADFWSCHSDNGELGVCLADPDDDMVSYTIPAKEMMETIMSGYFARDKKFENGEDFGH